MPFATKARITLEHRGEQLLGGALPALWYHIDYETYEQPLPPEALRFHAEWRQEKSTIAVGPQPASDDHQPTVVIGLDAMPIDDGLLPRDLTILDATAAAEVLPV